MALRTAIGRATPPAGRLVFSWVYFLPPGCPAASAGESAGIGNREGPVWERRCSPHFVLIARTGEIHGRNGGHSIFSGIVCLVVEAGVTMPFS